jgi:hypothetical protein
VVGPIGGRSGDLVFSGLRGIFSLVWLVLADFGLIFGGLGRKVGPKMADWEIELQVEWYGVSRKRETRQRRGGD